MGPKNPVNIHDCIFKCNCYISKQCKFLKLTWYKPCSPCTAELRQEEEEAYKESVSCAAVFMLISSMLIEHGSRVIEVWAYKCAAFSLLFSHTLLAVTRPRCITEEKSGILPYQTELCCIADLCKSQKWMDKNTNSLADKIASIYVFHLCI